MGQVPGWEQQLAPCLCLPNYHPPVAELERVQPERVFALSVYFTMTQLTANNITRFRPKPDHHPITYHHLLHSSISPC